MTARRLGPALVLLVILAGLAVLKANFEFGLGPRSHDADYYYDIARHVAGGQGLQSNLSLYFQGFQSFPHPVTSSPVWPLVLGGVGSVLGMERVAHALPIGLYFVDLILLYFLALRVHARVAGDRGWLFRPDRVVNFGHVAVLLFGMNERLFRFTSVPNNEALAFFFVFAALLAVDRAAQRSDARFALLAGVLGGLATLTRVQALAVAPILPAVLLFATSDLRTNARLAAVAALGAVAPFVPWAIHLSSWMEPLTLPAVLGMEAQFETPNLGRIEHTVRVEGLGAIILDRLDGLRVAFDPTTRKSYVHHYNTFAYLVPLAGVVFAIALLRRGFLSRALGMTRNTLVVACVAIGLGMLLPVHASHMAFASEWLFGFRHGLPLLFLILPALAYLDANPSRIVRWLAAVATVVGLGMSVGDMRTLLETDFEVGPRPYELAFIRWADAQIPTPSIITTRPWELGIWGRSGYHWILCESDPRQTLRLLAHAGADYVVLYEQDRRCLFVTGIYPERLEIIRSFGNGKILVLAPKGLSPRE